MATRFHLTNTPHRASNPVRIISSPLSRLLFCLSLVMGTSTAVQAASFDCAKATSSVEQAICNNAELSRLDTILHDNYQSALANLPVDQADALRSSQRDWLKQRNVCGSQEACLNQLMNQRATQLHEADKQATSALDAIIASIPTHPAKAAQQLRAYRGPLASAWLIYLHQFEPGSNVTDAEAEQRHQSIIMSMSDDSFAQSVLKDIEKDPKVSHATAVLTLLRMIIERAGYENQYGRPYAHCFVFKRQGADAYQAFGPLYGSSRDSQAPICSPQGDLFERPAWKRLSKLINPMLEQASKNSGTIRFASYAEWSMFRLQATVSPEDFLKPSQRVPEARDPEQQIRSWADNNTWPKEQRDTLLAAIEPARLATMGWLQTERSFSASDAAKASNMIVTEWLSDRMDFILEMSGSPE